MLDRRAASSCLVDQGPGLRVLLLKPGGHLVKVAAKLVVSGDPKLLDLLEGALDLSAHAVHRIGGGFDQGLEVVQAADHGVEQQAVVVDSVGRRGEVLLVALLEAL